MADKVTYVTINDFKGITSKFTDDEIKIKYGKLKIASEKEYQEMKKNKKGGFKNE